MKQIKFPVSKNLTTILTPLLMGVSLTLVACGEDNANNENKTVEATEVSEQTSNSVSSDKTTHAYTSPLPDTAPTYHVAMFEYVPFKFKDEYGNDMGYDVDIIRAIGEEAGFKVKLTQVPFKNLLKSVQDGKYDLAMSGLSILPERQALMLSSKPYSKGRAGYLVQSSLEDKSLDYLQDKRVAVLENSSLHGILKEKNTANIILEPTMFLAFQAIFTDHADSAFGMEPTLFYQSDQFSEVSADFVPFSDPIMTTVYAGKDKQEMITKVNEGLDKIKANGRYNKINQKWFTKHADDIAID